MAGLNVTLNIAEQTLLNTQTELATASNNISNATTDGYAVETAVQVENPAIQTLRGWAGTGASISTISQARDSYLEQQLMNATTSDSQYTKLASELSTIQATASDSGSTGISEALGNFFDAWSTLAQDPTGSSEQTQVYSASQNLANAIQSTYSQLNDINTQLSSQVSDTRDQVNSLIRQIAQINTGIAQSSTPTSQSNNLIDEQYAAMDSLSKLIPVTFSTEKNGTVDVSTKFADGSSKKLVTGETVDYTIAPSDSFSAGQLGALMEAQTKLDPTNSDSYMSKLNYFADTLIKQVDSVSKLSIFSSPTASNPTAPAPPNPSASNIVANSSFLSGQTSSQLATVAQAMSNLQDSTESFSDGTSSTLQGYLDSVQQQIGSDVQDANNNQSFYDSLKSELQKQQQSVSGVSMDEEMVHVIQFQQIYQAAAKVVETASTCMTTAINMVQ